MMNAMHLQSSSQFRSLPSRLPKDQTEPEPSCFSLASSRPNGEMCCQHFIQLACVRTLCRRGCSHHDSHLLTGR